ncbi:MAG: hypothetical protein CL608_12750 [Anaerolineaceae bacterium]|nr:hypothetical protein [Anaerolineaceae bacterium]
MSIPNVVGASEQNQAASGWQSKIFTLLRAEIFFIVILLLGTALRFYGLGAESLWVDEGTSISVARLSLPGILANRIFKNPPFYFILLHYWVEIFGDSELALRFLSALFGALSLPVMFWLGRRLLGRQAGLLSAFLLAISLFHIEFSQEARAYSLMVLLVLLSMFLFVRLFERFSRWTAVGYVLVNVVLLYTHFFGVFIVAAQNLFWLFMYWQRRPVLPLTWQRWVALQAATLLLFAPWLRYLLLEVQAMQATGVWIPVPTVGTLWSTALDYASESTLLLFLFAGLVLFVVVNGRSSLNQTGVHAIWQDRTAVYLLLLLWLILPVIVPFVASRLIVPFLIPRYTIAASLGLYLLVAAALGHIRWPSLRYGLLVLIALTSLMGVSRYYAFVDKQQWREVAARLEDKGQAGDVIVFNPGGIRENAFAYYFGRNDMRQVPLDLPFDLATSYTDEEQYRDLGEIDKLVADANRVWLVQANSNDTEGVVAQRLTALYETAEQFPLYGVELSLFANRPQMDAAVAAGPMVTQVIRYRLPEAAAVKLVWGVDGWQLLPPASQREETAVIDNLMVTAMQKEGETFVAEVQVPPETALDYVFQVTEGQQHAPVDLWDTQNGQDYQILVGTNESVIHESGLSVDERTYLAETAVTTQEIRYRLPGATAVNLVWGINGWQSLPTQYWPPDTELVDGLLYTPMSPGEDGFSVTVPVAQRTQLDYVFQTFVDNGAERVEVWDTNQGADYQVTAVESEVVEIRPSLTIQMQQLVTRAPGWGWPLWLGLGLVVLSGGYLAARQKQRWQIVGAFFSSRRWLYLRDLMRELISRDIKLRYKGSILGILWSLLNPFTQLLVFSFVFQALLPLDISNYPAYLFTGLLAWGWFNASLTASATVILEGRDLIRRPGFPPIVLPVVTVGSNLIHFLLSLPILLLFLLFTNIVLTPNVFWLPVIIVLQFLFTLSLAYFVATFHVMFRDTQHLLNVFLLLLFYLTPIFYDAGRFSERIQWLFKLNPLLMLLDAYRAIFINGQAPNFVTLLILLSGSLGLLVVGYQLFLRTSYRFVEEL